jgi:RimJ/RimL family protein N-acetyltransferase
MELEIREARAEDAAALLEHVHRLLREPDVDVAKAPEEFTLSEEQEARVLEEYAAAENRLFLVAYSAGTLVGELNLKGGTHKAFRHNVVLGMSVRKGWRNRGVGSALMKQAIRWAKEAPVVRRLELSVFVRNQAAIHLYEKFGFVREGRRRGRVAVNGEYLDDLVMGLWLEKGVS